MIFSPLKKAWSKAQDKHKRATGNAVNKTIFLVVYATAHLNAFSRENILAAFCKTGVVPFNPSVIPASDLAPSHTTLTTAGLALPLDLPSQHVYDTFESHLACSHARFCDVCQSTLISAVPHTMLLLAAQSQLPTASENADCQTAVTPTPI